MVRVESRKRAFTDRQSIHVSLKQLKEHQGQKAMKRFEFLLIDGM